jgi:hypothetical protein
MRCNLRRSIAGVVARRAVASGLSALLLAFGTTQAGAEHNDPSHGIWTQSIFFRGYNPTTGSKLRMKDLVKLAGDANANNVRDLYIFAGPYHEDGSIPDYAFSQTARESVRRLKQLAPRARVLPWLGGLQDKTVFLNKPEWRARAITDTIRLMRFLDVDGAHLDFEYILPTSVFVTQTEHIPDIRSPQEEYHPSMRAFFREFRERSPTAFLSTVFPSSAPEVTPWKINPTRRDIEEIAPLVDQISFLYYDTSIKSQERFEAGMRHQLEDIVAARSLAPKTEFIVAFGTFINYIPLHPYRDLTIENLPNSFATLKRTIDAMGGRNPLSGISLFCEWETDDSEWKQFRTGTALISPFASSGTGPGPH